MATQLLDYEDENEKLQIFLFEMADRQEVFLDTAQAEGYSLDYTLDSLVELERYIETHKLQMQWLDKSDGAVSLRVDCWSYLGETFRKTYGGGWNVSLNDLDSINYGQFVIEDFDETKQEFDPLGILQGYLLRGKSGSLRRSVDSYVDFKPIDLSDLGEENT